MNPNNNSIELSLAHWSWALLWFLMPWSLKGSVFALWLMGMVLVFSSRRSWHNLPIKVFTPVAGFILIFVWYLISLSLHGDLRADWAFLERKLSLLIVPMLLILARHIMSEQETWALRGLLAGLLSTGTYLIGMAILRLIREPGADAWMYHGFTEPIALGAIYFSWYLSVAILYLLVRQPEALINRYKYYIIALLMGLLLLSASKLFVFTTLLIMTGYGLRQGAFKWARSYALIIPVLLLLSIPFLLRMAELKETRLKVVCQQEFRYDTPFTGVTIRLLQWRFGWEILQEQQAFLTGVGIHKTQELLDAKYLQYGVYSGNPQLGDTGYLGYNFHNQYIETLVGTGWIGLILLTLALLHVFRVQRSRWIFPLPVFILSLLFFLIESVLERQAGILMFSLLAFASDERSRYA